MKNVKMKTKLLLGFFIPIVLTVINAGIGIWSTNRIINSVQGMYATEYATIEQTLKDIGANEEKSQQLLGTVADEITNSADTLHKLATQMDIVSVSLIVVSIIITLVIALSIIKAIMVSVRELSGAAKDIALGRVDINLVKHGNDEFGMLVDEYRDVISNIKYQAQIAEEVSHGNLTVTVNPKSPDDLLGNSLKKLVEDNLSTLSNISDAGTQVTISSSQVASASQALAQGSTEQASAIQEITASIDEIADKTKQNAEQANEAAGLVVHAIEDVKKGNQQMADMVNAMQDINQSSESISKIIKTIDDIAFQTNILALNAAVEAARAGEAGRGFAVVAEEIRKLADQSKESGNKIRSIVENIGSTTDKTTASAKKAAGMVNDQAHALEETVKVFGMIQTCVSELVEGIRIVTERLGQVVEEEETVRYAIQNISSVSEEVAASTEEVTATIGGQVSVIEKLKEEVEILSKDAAELGKSIDRFEI